MSTLYFLSAINNTSAPGDQSTFLNDPGHRLMSESSVSHLQRPLSTNIEPGLWRPVIENTKEDRIQKLPFEIVACSGWDDDYPPEELLIQNHTPLAKGWQSQRFCSYPQRLVVRFVAGNCRVRKLQILSHHFKVPTKLEFYIGTALNVGNATANEESDYELKLPKSKLETMSGQTGKQIVFTELGFVTLGDNASTNYRARELKTIHLDAKGSVLQILVHRCYINPLNLYNQVGIIGLNMLGEILDTNYIISGYEEGTYPLLGLDPLKQSLQTKHSGQSPEATIPRNNTNAAYWGQLMSTDVDAKIATTKDLAFDIYHDEQIATLIDAVLEAKKIAVAEEKFPLAKCLASLFDLCVKAGKEIAQMMVSKHRAIEAEQYDSAEQTKKDIEWMRFSLLAKIEELGLRLTKDERIVPAKGEYPTAKSQTTISTKTDKKQVRELKQHNKPNTTVSVSTEEHPRRTKNNNAPIPPQDHGKADASVSTSFSDIFKEPARDLKPAGLDDPERLSADEEALWAVPIDVHGIFLIRCLLTPKFKLREFALSEVSKRLDLWDRRQHERRKLLKNKRREKAVGQETRELRRTNRHANSDNEEVRSARRRRRSSSVVSFRSDDGNTNRTWSSRVSSDDSDSQVTEAVRTPSRKVDNSSSKLNPLLKQLDDSDGKESIWTREQLLEQEQIRTRWYGEVQAKQVSVETFLRATLQIIGKGLDDPREKTALLSLTLWEQLTRVCSKHKISPQIVYKAFDDVVPLLLLRSSDLNSRVRQVLYYLPKLGYVLPDYNVYRRAWISQSLLPMLTTSNPTASSTFF
ncbi:hypothetical protein BJ742DRAFT_565401 [Cladochytrium replicatum]|nr:hypothetical protein BJ742DRAFT_565401 [Cladochytrium replicatum]